VHDDGLVFGTEDGAAHLEGIEKRRLEPSVTELLRRGAVLGVQYGQQAGVAAGRYADIATVDQFGTFSSAIADAKGALIEHDFGQPRAGDEIEDRSAHGDRGGGRVDGIGRFRAVSTDESERAAEGIDGQVLGRVAAGHEICFDQERTVGANDQARLVVKNDLDLAGTARDDQFADRDIGADL
jgi:hypothetical protein